MYKSSDFSNRLKELRIKSGYTQAEMAEKCGVSARMWVKYEQGVSLPGAEVLLKFAYLGFDMEYLFTGIILTEEEEREVVLLHDENKLIENFRAATNKSKEIILAISEMVEKKEHKEKQEDGKKQYFSFL